MRNGRGLVDTGAMAIGALRPPVELVALLASAGGLDSLGVVLGDLPTEFPAALVVHQHLGGHTSVLPAILAERTPLLVDWARDGQVVVPGRVLVCPPGMHMELKPGGFCCLRPAEGTVERRFDVLLASVASSYGPRGVGVVLSGSGRDGAQGTAAMKLADAIVIAESPETAEFSSMPIAAARAGADLVLPNYEIGQVLSDIIEGAPLPPPRPEVEAVRAAAPPPESLTEGPAEETYRDATAAGGQSIETGDVTTADHGTEIQLSPRRAIEDAAVRAEAAAQRVAELRRRREELAAGRGATAHTVATAQFRAQESLRRAQRAREAAEKATQRLNRA